MENIIYVIRGSFMNQAHKPLVTIAIPTYNHGQFLPFLMESIYSQTYQNFEILIFDNCSEDDTQEIINPYLKDSRIHYTRNPYNMGPYVNWGFAFEQGNGLYKIILSADDALHPRFLESTVEALENHPECSLAYTKYVYMNDQNELLHEVNHPGYKKESYYGGRNEIADLLVFDSYLAPSAVLFRPSCLKGSFWDEECQSAADWFGWITLFSKFPAFAFVNEPYCYYRVHANQQTQAINSSIAPLKNHICVLEKSLKNPEISCWMIDRKHEIFQHLLRRYEQYKTLDETKDLLPRISAIENALNAFEIPFSTLPKEPLVSIIMPTLNRNHLLPHAIDSLLNQSYTNWELLLVNDGGEPINVEKFDQRIRYFELNTNYGQSVARNIALRLAKGEIICYLDDDDIFLGNHIQTIVDALQENVAQFVYTDSQHVDQYIENGTFTYSEPVIPYSHIEYSKERLRTQNFIPINTWAHRRECFDKTGLFNESLNSLEDWELLLRFSEYFHVKHIEKVTVEVRHRPADAENVSSKQRKNFYDIYKKIYELHDNLGNSAIENERQRMLEGLRYEQQKYFNTVSTENAKAIVAYIADPFDNNNFLDLTLNVLSPIANLKDYGVEPLLQRKDGRYHIKTELLSKAHAIIIYDKVAYLSHLIPQLKACGIPVIFMVHTDVWHVDVKHSNKEALDLLRPHYTECIKNADVIVTSNEYISHYIGAENKVITPFIDSSPWKFPIEKLPRFSDKFTLAVYIDMNNLNDISMIAKFMQTIQEKYADELYFVVHGINCSPNELEALNFVDVKLTKINNYLQYINFIRTQPIDAVLTPLLANQHNLTISPFNYFINALSDVAGIYSNWGLYKEVVQHGVTGFLCGENELDWEAAIVTLMHYPDTRQQICEAAKKQVLENFTVDNTLRNVYNLLESLSAHKLAVDQLPRELEKSFTQYELKSLLSYPAWCERKALQYIDIKEWELLSDGWETMPSFHFFINVNALKLDKLADTIESFIAQLYPEWNLYLISPDSSPNPLFDQHPKLHWIQTEVSTYDAVNHVMGEMQNGMIGFLEAGDRLQPHGLAAYSELYNHTKYHLIYADHDTIDGGNRIYPQFKPDFNLDMFRSKNYIARSFVISSMALKELGGIDSELRDGELFDLILRYIDHFGESAIAHYNDILHSCILNDQESDIDLSAISSKIALKKHLLRNGLSGEVVDNKENSFRILYHHETRPLVSIIIPTKNQYHYLRPCIESILEKTAYNNYEIIIVDNNSDEKDAIEYLKSLKKHKHIQVVPYNKPFNYSTANNIGAKHAQGEFLLLLNNDTEVLHENWLDVLLSYGQRQDVGIVGPRLIYPNQTIQHAGVIVGLDSSADHQFVGADLDDPGYMSRLQIDQNLSAVTAAAMLVKRTAFDTVLGLNDIDYGVNFSDIDLCLKIFSAGYKIIYTPHATLLHHGSVTQKNTDPKKRIERDKIFMSDRHAFRSKWQDIILNDPSYNTNLDTSDAFMPIRLKALAHWNPLLKSPIPKIFGMSRGHDGGGFYRITSPLQGLQSLAKAQTSFVYKNYTAPYIAMQQPDIIIYQTPLHDNMITFLEYIKTYHPDITLIFEIDDLLTNIPIDNRAFHKQYKDTKKRMVKGLKYCDRMVVSTQPLKDAFQSYIDDIRIIPNYLPKSVWGDLHSKRNRSEKLRVGWAGSIFHKGDLAIISKLVENYHDAVEWVFFGMAPEGLDGKIEFHPGVSLDLYPEKLATLDLDLALVPLEDNAFNAAKSNLRLLEFGILGWPVICSDVYPYRGAPVTRVKNRYKDWEKAFLSKISDLEVLKNEGDQLKKWVKDNYILEDHVDFIYQQYTEQKK